MEDKFSFYFQKNNSLFNGDVLSICYTVSSRDVLKYGLTSDKVIIKKLWHSIQNIKGITH